MVHKWNRAELDAALNDLNDTDGDSGNEAPSEADAPGLVEDSSDGEGGCAEPLRRPAEPRLL